MAMPLFRCFQRCLSKKKTNLKTKFFDFKAYLEDSWLGRGCIISKKAIRSRDIRSHAVVVRDLTASPIS